MIATQSRRRGFTLIELILAMVVGLIVLSSVTGYVRSTDRTIAGMNMRDDYARKARFIGLTLRRDIGEAGVGIESLRGWGTVAVYGDTVIILKVPYTPNAEPSYTVVPPAAVLLAGNVPPFTTHSNNAGCGNNCLRLRRVAAGTALTLVPGSLARVQQGTIRRLVAVTAVGSVAPATAPDSLSMTFVPLAGLFRRPSITQVAGNRLNAISISNTGVQRMEMVAFWRDPATNFLWRATRVNSATGALIGEVIATGVSQFESWITFQDGGVADNADSTAASTRWYNAINAVNIRATFQADQSDARINGGVPLRRTFVYKVQPRNLLYERNRDN